MKRRTFNKGILGAMVGTAVCAKFTDVSAAAKAPEDMRPQEGDYLVYAKGPKKGEPLLASDLELEQEQIIAFPFDPEAKITRDGSRFNKLMAIRLNPDELDENTGANGADGVVVYSAICTHQGCDVNSWVADKKQFFCYCHLTLFDPMKSGKVVSGPAQRKLPMLPISIDKSERIMVASSFTSKPGYKK